MEWVENPKKQKTKHFIWDKNHEEASDLVCTWPSTKWLHLGQHNGYDHGVLQLLNCLALTFVSLSPPFSPSLSLSLSLLLLLLHTPTSSWSQCKTPWKYYTTFSDFLLLIIIITSKSLLWWLRLWDDIILISNK